MISSSVRAPSERPGLLHNRNFILLWCAYGISAMGDHISEMAILKTQGALDPDTDVTPLMARMTFVFFVPFFLLGPVAGLLADALPRRGLMILADLSRCGIMLAFGYLIAAASGWGLWGPFAPLLLLGGFAVLFSPARSALLPTLVRDDQLVRANGLISGLGIIATMAAALASGYLADHYPALVAFRVDAGTYFASAALLLLLRAPRGVAPRTVRKGGRSGPRAELVAGFRYARSHRHVLELLAVAAVVWFCGPVVNSVIPAIVRDVYGGTYTDISAYRGLLGLGFVVGASMVTIVGASLRGEVAITWGLFGIAGAIALFAVSVFAPWSAKLLARIGMVAIILAGVFGVTVMASFNALLQHTVADRFRGRIFGLKDLVCTGSLLVATGALGVPEHVRVDRWVGWLLVGVAVFTLAAGAVSLRIRMRRTTDTAWFHFLRYGSEFICRFWWRLERVGPCTVPRTGGVIVTANHRSVPDPLLLHACVSYRVLSFLIAAEYVHLPLVRTVVRAAHCIPVRRETRETSATKQALRHLKSGGALAAFIEGGMVRPGERRRPKDGMALLALRAEVPVIPAYIEGTYHTDGVFAGLVKRHQARIRFGPPVDLDEFRTVGRSRNTVRAATQKIFAAIQALAPVDDGPAPAHPGSSAIAEATTDQTDRATVHEETP